jgi:hypothetical protein
MLSRAWGSTSDRLRLVVVFGTGKREKEMKKGGGVQDGEGEKEDDDGDDDNDDDDGVILVMGDEHINVEEKEEEGDEDTGGSFKRDAVELVVVVKVVVDGEGEEDLKIGGLIVGLAVTPALNDADKGFVAEIEEAFEKPTLEEELDDHDDNDANEEGKRGGFDEVGVGMELVTVTEAAAMVGGDVLSVIPPVVHDAVRVVAVAVAAVVVGVTVMAVLLSVIVVVSMVVDGVEEEEEEEEDG